MIYILSGLLIILCYALYVVYTKNVQFENIIKSNNKELADIEGRVIEFMENLLITYTKVLTKLVRIDRNGGFESDDEVGFVFKTLKNTIEELKIEIEHITAIVNDTNIDDDDENDRTKN